MSDDQEGIDVRPEDALQVAQRALTKINEHEDRFEELVEDVTRLKLRLSEIDEDRPYEALSLDEKVGKVREYGFQQAQHGHGKATLDYKNVMWGVFEGQPGPKHCYKLIRRAAGLTDTDDNTDRPTGGEYPGFRARDPDGENYHLAVDAEKAKQSMAFFPENKTTSEGGQSA